MRVVNKVLIKLAATAGVGLAVAGCGASSTPSLVNRGPDLGAVLDRTAKVLVSYQDYMQKLQVEVATAAHIDEMKGLLRQVMNMDPQLYHNPIGITLRKDAAFTGFDDRNDNNVKDADEKQLFKVEIDHHGRRLIATGESRTAAVRPSGSRFFAGVLMNRFASKQRAAGIDRKAFANRKISSLRPAGAVGGRTGLRPARAVGGRAGSQRARGRTRSGGHFRGK